MSNRAEELSCGHCNFITNDVDDLEMHLKVKHSAIDQEKFQCHECDFSTNTERNLKRHNANRHNPAKGKQEDVFKCALCDFTCSSSKGIGTHRYRAHLLQAFQRGNESQMEPRPEEEEAGEEKPSPKSVQKVKESPKADANTPRTNKPSTKPKGAGPSDLLKVCIRCSVCEFMCNSLRSMAEHIDVVHSADAEPQSPGTDGDNVDHDDDVMATKDDVMVTEEFQPEANNQFKCPSCDVSYDKRWKVTRHLKYNPSHISGNREEEEEEAVTEDEISVNESHNQDLEDSNAGERESHESPGPSCNWCGKIFSSTGNLNRHVTLKHQGENYSDKNMMAAEEDSMPSQVTPLQSETSSKKFECEICGSKFSRRFSLKQHQIRLHSAPERREVEMEEQEEEEVQETSEINPCCPVCGKDFISETDLQRHIQRRHSSDAKVRDGEKSDNTVYSCKVCSEKVIGKSNLESHNKKYHLNTSKRQIAFSDCDAVDDAGEELDSKRAKGVADIAKKLLDCSLCDAKLGSKSPLFRHRKNVHG